MKKTEVSKPRNEPWQGVVQASRLVTGRHTRAQTASSGVRDGVELGPSGDGARRIRAVWSSGSCQFADGSSYRPLSRLLNGADFEGRVLNVNGVRPNGQIRDGAGTAAFRSSTWRAALVTNPSP